MALSASRRGIPERERARPTSEPRLRIAMLAPPWIPIPPPGYGGIEFVVALLCDALVERGHEVHLYCTPRSLAFAQIDAAADAGRPFDVIHDRSGYTALAFADRQPTPLVHTVHGPFDQDTTPYYARHGVKGRIVCISHTQAGYAPPETQVSAVVHNPIDVDSWPVGYVKDDYLLFVARMTEEKGPHRAIAVAKKTHRPLILAGPVQPGQERFFANEVEPHAPEIVEHGVNGFLVRDEDEMAAVVERATDTDPARCRQTAAERFAPDRVAAGYESVYREALRARFDGHRQPEPVGATT